MCSFPCCSIYSATGVLFLLFVYAVLSLQPEFVAGVDDYDRAKTSALGAAATFAVTFVVSVAGILWRDGRCGRGDDALADDDDGRGRYQRLNINLDYQLSSSFT